MCYSVNLHDSSYYCPDCIALAQDDQYGNDLCPECDEARTEHQYAEHCREQAIAEQAELEADSTARSMIDLDLVIRQHSEYAQGQEFFASQAAHGDDAWVAGAVQFGESSLGHAMNGGAVPGGEPDIAGLACASGWLHAATAERDRRFEVSAEMKAA